MMLCNSLIQRVPVPGRVTGRSLAPALADRDHHVRERLYLAYWDSQRAIKDRRYKLIKYRAGDGPVTQLFDLETDPWEMSDLAERPDQRQQRGGDAIGSRGGARRLRRDGDPFGPAFWGLTEAGQSVRWPCPSRGFASASAQRRLQVS